MAFMQSVASHLAAASKGQMIRCTVLGSTPNRAAILRTLSPVSFGPLRTAGGMRASMSAAIRGAARAACPQPWPAEAQRAPVPGSLNARTQQNNEHLKHRLAARRRGVDALLVQETDRRQQRGFPKRKRPKSLILQAKAIGTATAVAQHIELAAGCRRSFRGIERWPLVLALRCG